MFDLATINSVLQGMSDGDKSFWGNVAGAVIGTIGALLVALIAVWLDRLRQKQKDQLAALREYNENLIIAEISLNEILPVMNSNQRLFKKCFDQKDGDFMGTLPRTLAPRELDIGSLRNPQLVNEWLTFTLRSQKINDLIEDFNESYKRVRDTVFDLAIRGDKQKIDVDYVVGEHKALKDFAKQVNNGVKLHTEDALRLLAIARLHGEIAKTPGQKFIKPSELDKFELERADIEAKLKELRKEFDPSKTHKDL